MLLVAQILDYFQTNVETLPKIQHFGEVITVLTLAISTGLLVIFTEFQAHYAILPHIIPIQNPILYHPH